MNASLPPEQIVRQQAEQRVQAMKKGDLAALYELTSPGYRKLRSLDAFKGGYGTGARWQQAEVAKVACEPERCIVDVTVQAKPLMPGKNLATIAITIQDTWLLEDGKWWLYQGL